MWDGGGGRTLRGGLHVVLAVAEAGHPISDAHAALELLLHCTGLSAAKISIKDGGTPTQVALVQEQDDLRVAQQLVRADHLPQEDTVLLHR